ncbi:MAG: penicillin-binding protein activator [Firmicutes bacterium]|nr:penicillin-binding protein activator [Bacillota bacterium]
MLRYKQAFALLTALALVLLCGCESYDNFYKTFFEAQEAAASVVRIGVFEPFTGADAEAAADEIEGIRLAHSLYPQVLGMEVELVEADNQSDVTLAPQVAQELAEAGVSIVLGSCKSTLSLAASDVFKENKLPAIAVTCANPIITETSSYYVRVCTIDSYSGYAAAVYAYERLGAKSVSVLKKEGDDYNDALIKAFTAKMKSYTGSDFSVNLVEYPPDTEDFSEYIFQASTTDSGVIYFPCAPEEAIGVIRQAAEEDYSFTWLGSSSWQTLDTVDPSYAENGETFLNGICYVADLSLETSSQTEAAQLLREAYAQAHGEGAEPSYQTALGFDAYLLALQAMELAGTSSDTLAISKSLYNVYGLEGASGTLSLDSNGDPIKAIPVNMIRAGGHAQVYVVNPKWGK